MSDGKDELERWIDEGVRCYVAAEPPLGMERRVLVALEERQPLRRWWRRWMIAVPVAALLAIVVGFSLRPKTRPQPATAPQVAVNVPAAPPKPSVDAGGKSMPQLKAHVARPVTRRKSGGDAPTGAANRMSNPQQFPSPVPATEQERLLARLVQDRAAAQTVAAAKAAERQEELVISRITITPIEIPLLPAPNPGE